jgi:hypothetical protein
VGVANPPRKVCRRCVAWEGQGPCLHCSAESTPRRKHAPRIARRRQRRSRGSGGRELRRRGREWRTRCRGSTWCNMTSTLLFFSVTKQLSAAIGRRACLISRLLTRHWKCGSPEQHIYIARYLVTLAMTTLPRVLGFRFLLFFRHSSIMSSVLKPSTILPSLLFSTIMSSGGWLKVGGYLGRYYQS